MKHAFFDLDNTLHDKRSTLICVAGVIYEVFELSAYCSLPEFQNRFVIENEIIQPKKNVFNNLRNTFNINEDPNIILKYFDDNFHLYCKPYPGAIKCLKWLSGIGMTIGCITNGRDFFQRNKIEGLGMTSFFDCIVTSGETGIKKPDHGIFNIALSKMKASAKYSFYCGDNERADIVPAQALGLTTILRTECMDVESAAHYKFTNFSELPSIIKRL